jgi:hypothetical protein
MTFSYSADQLSNPLYAARLAFGDTVCARPLFSDQEWNQFIGMRGSLAGACAIAARVMGTRFATLVDQSASGVSIKYSQAAKQWAAMAYALEADASITALVFAGGISIADKIARVTDTDRADPFFYRDMMTNVIPVAPVNLEGELETQSVASNI